MKKISVSRHDSLNELNITPLLDLAFVLLVIFIITTPQLVNNLEMNLPSAPVPQPTNAVPRKPSQIVVTSAGRITLDGQPHDLASLRPALGLLKKGDPELALVVRGAAATEYQHVVAVLDLVQQLDITRVGLATEQ